MTEIKNNPSSFELTRASTNKESNEVFNRTSFNAKLQIWEHRGVTTDAKRGNSDPVESSSTARSSTPSGSSTLPKSRSSIVMTSNPTPAPQENGRSSTRKSLDLNPQSLSTNYRASTSYWKAQDEKARLASSPPEDSKVENLQKSQSKYTRPEGTRSGNSLKEIPEGPNDTSHQRATTPEVPPSQTTHPRPTEPPQPLSTTETNRITRGNSGQLKVEILGRNPPRPSTDKTLQNVNPLPIDSVVEPRFPARRTDSLTAPANPGVSRRTVQIPAPQAKPPTAPGRSSAFTPTTKPPGAPTEVTRTSTTQPLKPTPPLELTRASTVKTPPTFEEPKQTAQPPLRPSTAEARPEAPPSRSSTSDAGKVSLVETKRTTGFQRSVLPPLAESPPPAVKAASVVELSRTAAKGVGLGQGSAQGAPVILIPSSRLSPPTKPPAKPTVYLPAQGQVGETKPDPPLPEPQKAARRPTPYPDDPANVVPEPVVQPATKAHQPRARNRPTELPPNEPQAQPLAGNKAAKPDGLPAVAKGAGSVEPSAGNAARPLPAAPAKNSTPPHFRDPKNIQKPVFSREPLSKDREKTPISPRKVLSAEILRPNSPRTTEIKLPELQRTHQQPQQPLQQPPQQPQQAPQRAPQQTPQQTPQQAPQQTPQQTPQRAPQQTPQQAPQQTPQQTPQQAPQRAPQQPSPKIENASLGVSKEEEERKARIQQMREEGQARRELRKREQEERKKKEEESRRIEEEEARKKQIQIEEEKKANEANKKKAMSPQKAISPAKNRKKEIVEEEEDPVERVRNGILENTLKVMDMKMFGLEDEELASFLEELAGNTSVTSLQLDGNEMQLMSCESLSNLLKSNTTITEISLNFVGLNVLGSKTISQGLAINTSLTSLSAKGNDLFEVGMYELGQGLKFNKGVKVLKIAENTISDGGAKAIEEMMRFNQTITELDISNNYINEEGASVLAKMMETNTSITSLNLERNSIEDGGCSALANSLEKNHTLKHLFLGNNIVGSGGIISIAEALMGNESLVLLDISKNIVDIESEIALQKAMLHKNGRLNIYWKVPPKPNPEIPRGDVQIIIENFGVANLIDMYARGGSLYPLIDIELVILQVIFSEADAQLLWDLSFPTHGSGIQNTLELLIKVVRNQLIHDTNNREFTKLFAKNIMTICSILKPNASPKLTYVKFQVFELFKEIVKFDDPIATLAIVNSEILQYSQDLFFKYSNNSLFIADFFEFLDYLLSKPNSSNAITILSQLFVKFKFLERLTIRFKLEIKKPVTERSVLFGSLTKIANKVNQVTLSWPLLQPSLQVINGWAAFVKGPLEIINSTLKVPPHLIAPVVKRDHVIVGDPGVPED